MIHQASIALIVLLTVILGHQSLPAQQHGYISGVVKDAESGEPLPFANVFFNNSTIGTVTSERGEFTFQQLQPGSYRLIVSYIGYETFEKEVNINARVTQRLTVLMTPLKKVLNEVNITAERDKSWEKLIPDFEAVFLGGSKKTRKARILNPGVIDLAKERGVLTATAQEPIVVENQSLGYIIHYYLKKFSAGEEDFYIEGYARFEEMKDASNQQKAAWITNRDKAYKGSLRHFLASCINNNLEEQGFRLYVDSMDSNLPIHSGRGDFFADYEKMVTRAEPFLKISYPDSLSANIRINRRLEIHYLNEKTKEGHYADVTHQVSRIFVRDSILQSLLNGIIVSPNHNWTLWGDMTLQRMGDLLPVDYRHQQSGHLQLKGTIVDARTKKGIKDANVFLNHTSLGTFTSRRGLFGLTGVPDGFYDFVIFKPGYSPFLSRLRIEGGKSYSLNLELQPIKAERSAPRRTRNLLSDSGEFLTGLFGFNPGDSCVISNPEVVRVSKRDDGNYVFNNEALIIENRQTGYQVMAYIMPTKMDTESDFAGYYWFNPLIPESYAESRKRDRNRMMNFQGSERHFLSALVNQTYQAEGFSLFDRSGNSVSPVLDTLENISGYFQVDFNDFYRVSYVRANSIADLYNRVVSTGDSLIQPVSKALVNSRGVLLKSNSLPFSGSMSAKRLAAALPLDYVPPVREAVWNTISKYQETVFVHTNKAYYHPGDKIFFTAFLHYTDPSLKDSLSRIVYAELINYRKEVVDQKLLKIEDGVAAGVFALQKELPHGTYRLRAYTNWMLNFDEPPFQKGIEVLAVDTNYKITGNAEECEKPGVSEFPNVSIKTNKKIYNRRQRIEVQVIVTDSSRLPVAAGFSCAVTDAKVVADLFQRTNLIENRSNQFSGKPLYPIETALSMKGKVINARNKKVRLRFLNLNKQIVEETVTDHDGTFAVFLPDFFDSLNLSVAAFQENREFRPEIEWQERPVPAIEDFAQEPVDDAFFDKNLKEYRQYKAEEQTTVLQEVVVRARRPEPLQQPKASLIKPEYVIEADDLKNLAGNLLIGLQGKVPGVDIRCRHGVIDCQIFFTRAIGGSIHSDQQPLVLLNDIPMYGESAGAIFINLDPSMIERIEIQKSINVLFGEDGRNGVIALYTKAAARNASFQHQAAPKYQQVDVSGFNSPMVFNGPDYGLPALDSEGVDYRTTLYWNPFLRTDSISGGASFSFFAADIPTAYRIVVEGFTSSNKYFRASHCIVVK